MTHIVVTEPLGPRLAEAIRAPHAVYDDRMATGYFRPLPEGRLLWGGRVDALGRRAGWRELMRRDLACVFPQLADVAFDFAWSGAMGFARHRMPVVRPLAARLVGGASALAATGSTRRHSRASWWQRPWSKGDERWRLLDAFGLPWNGGALGPLAAQAFYLRLSGARCVSRAREPGADALEPRRSRTK